MASFLRKQTIKWARTLQKTLEDVLEEKAVPRLKEIILEDYDFELKDIANPKSKLAPERFQGEFSNRLDDFDYVDIEFKGVKFITPDMYNFDFRDGLEPIENILEGMVGKYVEVEHRDYVRATGRQTYRGKRSEVYLIRYTTEVRNWEKSMDKKFDPYAFSNTPPLDIFSRADQFVSDTMDMWINEAVEKSQKEFKV